MTIGITHCAAGNAIASALFTPDVARLAGEIGQLLRSDPPAASQAIREALSSLPAGTHGELAGALTTGLADHDLAELASNAAGRDLLDRLAAPGHGQADRIRAALFGSGADPGGWVQRVADQIAGRSWTGGAAAGTAARQCDAAQAQQVQDAFKQEFAAKAADPKEFDAVMQQVFGDRYDRALAEQFRQQALAGDFSFLPEVKFVDAATLQGGNGAYNAEEGVIYINRELAASDPAKAAQVFVEEAGAHLDAKLNTVDTQGDEGEMFRRLLAGEQLSAGQVAAIRADDDRGTITVDGKQVQVEFWFGEDIVDAVGDAGKAIGKAAGDVVDAVGGAAGDVVDHVGNAARNVVYSVGDAVKATGMGLIDGVGSFMQGFALDFFGGTFMNLVQGRFGDAWESMARGVDKMIFQAPRRVMNGLLEGAGHTLKTMTWILPDKVGGEFARDVIDRGVDSVRTVANGVVDIVRNVALLPARIVGDFTHDIGEALKHWARGDIGGGFERLGMAFVHPVESVAGTIVDNAMIAAQGVGNVIGNVFGLHEPSRGLSADERAYLKDAFGDSLNLDDIRIHRGNISHDAGVAPHTVGNDIYLPDNCFNADGTLNELGKATLMHEAFHVYQAQKGGNGYIHEALEAQVDGIVSTGNRNAGYNFLEPFRAGKPFDEWNPEQQAKFIEVMVRIRTERFGPDMDGDGVPDNSYDSDRNGSISRAELAVAIADDNHNGRVDGNETPVALTPQEYRALMAMAESTFAAMQADRPDRQVV